MYCAFCLAWLSILILTLPFTLAAQTDAFRLLLGGPVRLGNYALNKSARKQYETSLKLQEKKIDNHLGKSLYADLYYGRVGLGYRWMQYQLEGEDDGAKTTLAMNFWLPTAGIFLMDSTVLHPEVTTRFGFTFGKGRSKAKLNVEINDSSVDKTADRSDSVSGDTKYYELFIDNVQESGWGYRLAVFLVRTDYAAGIDGSSDPSLLLTAIKQF